MESDPKVIAFYLPQFHCIEENDKFWGAGFTEWTNVKKAVPIYKSHRQPRIPLNNNYYDLLDDQTFSWQIDLAKKYSLDGFCFYHYWFNGKLLLEKPCENYLNRKNLDLSFCFSWANEPWTKSWDGKNKSVLVDQTYENMGDINKHIEYLLPFFLDDRYIKINNRPLFLIYRANNINYIDTMIDTWNATVRKEGFDGIFFCETLTGFQIQKHSDKTDALVYMEPMWVIGRKNIFRKLLSAIHSPIKLNRLENYNKIWKEILRQEIINANNFAGAYVDWDNSPRKRNKNIVFNGSNPDNFRYYFQKLFKKVRRQGCPYIFINAWNEWAEGAYLEPDTDFGTGYLEAIRDIKLNNET
jgi:lipopolysaccharide biosynthesis protein